jgi:AbrB family looped-hinge helix DNA binding protein
MSTDSDKEAALETIDHVTVDSSGRIVLPSSVRERFCMKAGDKLSISSRDCGMVLRTMDQSLKVAQEYFKSLAPPDVLLSEELIEERREEARREEEEFREWREASRTSHTASKPPTSD